MQPRELHSLPSSLLDTLIEGCQVVGFDYTYRYLNDAAAEQGKRPKDQLLGRSMIEAYPGIDQTPMFALLRRCMEDRVPCRMDNEFRFPDGSVGWFELRFDPVPEGVFILSLDVTERRRFADQLVHLSAAIDQAGEGVAVTDSQGVIEYTNPAFDLMTGYSHGELAGKDLRILKHASQEAGLYKELWETLTRGDTWRGQLINQRKDGSPYLQKTTISPVHDAAGQTVRFVSVGRDVTIEYRREGDLRQSQKMETIGRLAGGIAHDFNNLLSVIIAYADVAMEDIDPESPLREDILRIREAGERAASLTGKLLAFSRKQVLQPKSLNLSKVIEGMSDMLRRLIGEHIEFVTTLDPAVAPVRADPVQIEQVVMNLALNARDAMPNGGRLAIRTSNVSLDDGYAQQHPTVAAGRYVMLSVTDSGIGMDETTRDRAFEPFFTTKKSGAGTGLGLATVYGIIKQSGGNIWVYSEPGKGTEFKIYLPASSRENLEAPPSVMTPMGAGRGETVLIVEDSAAVRTIAERILVADGYKVLVASSGSEALGIAQAHTGTIHLLLTDVVMPQMNGSELAERLTRQNRSLRVLFMSGYTDDAIGHHGVLDPTAHFLGKPFDSSALRRKVREVLEG